MSAVFNVSKDGSRSLLTVTLPTKEPLSFNTISESVRLQPMTSDTERLDLLGNTLALLGL